MRGEQIFAGSAGFQLSGSPPLARGTARLRGSDVVSCGITPACAGNSRAAHQSRGHGGDHPRLRGEQVQHCLALLYHTGSPPLARGTDFSPFALANILGITPACAGNRVKARARNNARQDHPRLRGEQPPRRQFKCRALGSPPLARGTDAIARIKNNAAGITPACAGNRLYRNSCQGVLRDHPRLRGEQPAPHAVMAVTPGSPPLARGTVLLACAISCGDRITPACAGNSGREDEAQSKEEDHPRLRGEQEKEIDSLLPATGSPPLARGTGPWTISYAQARRITPACAGNRNGSKEKAHRGRDHPRLRGEQPCYRRSLPPRLGSPPLARGTELTSL